MTRMPFSSAGRK